MGSLSSGELRMSDGMNDRASRSALGRIPGLGLSGRDIGDRGAVRAGRTLSERVQRAYARVHEGPTVPLSTMIYEARELVPVSCVTFSPSRGYVSTDTATIISGNVRFAHWSHCPL